MIVYAIMCCDLVLQSFGCLCSQRSTANGHLSRVVDSMVELLGL
jgi:hypothetical protein